MTRFSKEQAQIRQTAITRAQQLLPQQPIYLDTETTGIDDAAEIVEICIVGHNGQILVDSLVKPTIPIPKSATQVHGITNAMVRSAPTWPELWPEIQKVLTNHRVGIYNADFDLRLIRQSHRQAKMRWQSLGAKAICIMKLYAKFYGEWDDYRHDYRWQSLEKAGEQCGLKLSNTHRAKDDTLLARAVLYHMANSR